jgi:hypothetical protein
MQGFNAEERFDSFLCLRSCGLRQWLSLVVSPDYHDPGQLLKHQTQSRMPLAGADVHLPFS